ncbi:MAG: hypothetical protein PWQ79_1847 [Thermococcaceae archaeon]|nr:hypothetical protein [Thermococcaceae archaeon]MDK2914932.1 hypothetical protein [Thermococcaceae archaeon]
MRYDVLIIGGGPVGNYLANLLGDDGFRVAVVERKGAFGGKACTGVIGAKNFKRLGFPEEAILNELKGAIFYSRIQSFEVGRPTTQAYVVDRRTLERRLAEEAVAKGVDYYMSTSFIGFKEGRAIVQRPGERMEVEASFYVGADGVNSTVAKSIGTTSQAEFLTGYEVEVLGSFEPDKVEVWVNKDVNPDFFFWVAPISEKIARVGTFGSLRAFRDFLRIKGLKETSAVEYKAGTIGLGWRKPWVRGNVALLGDAALQIKPTTGGGIVFGAFCAHALRKAINNGDLSQYEKLCREIKKQVSFGLKLRKAFRELSQDDIERIFEVLGSREGIEVIESQAEFDDHFKTAKAIIKRPKLLARLIRISPGLIRYLL